MGSNARDPSCSPTLPIDWKGEEEKCFGGDEVEVEEI
jgi:hypothetical protein